MDTLSIPLSDSQMSFLKSQAAQNGLSSAVDYVQELIRVAEKTKSWAILEKAIENGLDSGEPFELTESHWQAKRDRLVKAHPEANKP